MRFVGFFAVTLWAVATASAVCRADDAAAGQGVADAASWRAAGYGAKAANDVAPARPPLRRAESDQQADDSPTHQAAKPGRFTSPGKVAAAPAAPAAESSASDADADSPAEMPEANAAAPLEPVTGGYIAAAPDPLIARQPTLLQPTPPDSVEGSWISDERSAGAAQQAALRKRLAAMQPSMAYEEPYAEGPCDDDGHGGHGHGHQRGFDCYGQPWGDLWTEVHSSRRVYVKPEYLQWRAKGNLVPALVTTSPIGTAQADAGVLPDAEILFGQQELDDQVRSGGRINVGYWLLDGEFYGIEGHYFNLDPSEQRFHAVSIFSDGNLADPILARPFFNLDPSLVPDAQSPFEDAALVAFPNFTPPPGSGLSSFDLDGRIDVRTFSDVQSAGAVLRHLVWIDFPANCRLDLIGGYRFFRLNNNIFISDSFVFPGQGQIAAVQFDSFDQFRADNQFHGGEIGLIWQALRGRFSMEATAKIAFGANFEEVEILGEHSATTLGVTSTAPGGFLAQPTNIGLYERDTFAMLPEANVTLRVDVTHRLRATVGYSFIYLNKVVRSGDQIDRTINPTQIDGTLDLGNPPDNNFARPRFQFKETDFWLYGFNAGLEYRW